MNKTVYTKVFLKQLGQAVSDENVKAMLPVWWYNTRNKDTGGLRLTDEGYETIKKLDITTYDIPFPLNMVITTQVIIFLDQFIDSPYYLTNKSIVVTNERKAVELSLFSGDIRKYGLTKALNRSKN